MRRVARRLVNSRRSSISLVPYAFQWSSHGKRTGTLPSSLLSLIPKSPFSTLRNSLRSDPSFLSPDVDLGFDIPSQTLETVLDRAKVHGITTLEQLAFEADLRPGQRRSGRLMNDDAIRQDLDLWAILLDYRHIKDGSGGVRDILSSMLREGRPVELYADSVSGYIWQQVLPVVIVDDKLLYELCQPESPFIRYRPLVFTDIIGQLLARDNVRLATILGTQLLLSSHFGGRPDLLQLFDITLQIGSLAAIQNLCHLISRLPRFHMYDETIPRLWEKGLKQHAYILHRHLLSIGDYPAKFEDIEPFIEDIASKGKDLEPFLRELETYSISFSHQARRLYAQHKARFSQALGRFIDRNLKSGPGSRPVKLSDAFVARTFATRSVSFDFVLSGLQFIGLFEVGPLAIRELALSASSIEELKRRFEQLESTKIDLGSSNYVRVIKNLCLSSDDKLLAAVLESDMHHEVFDDDQKQKSLLTEYSQEREKAATDRTLAILNSGKSDVASESISAQLLLQSALLKGDWRRGLSVLDQARGLKQADEHPIELGPLRVLLRRLWAQGRNSRSASDDTYISRQPYVAGLMQLAQGLGYPVRGWQWRSILHAVGRSGDWLLFSRLLLTVARMSFGNMPLLIKHERSHVSGQTSAIDQLLDCSFQSFIIEASLLCNTDGDDASEAWRRAVDLLYALKHRFHANVDYDSVGNGMRDCLHELFEDVEGTVQADLIEHYLGCLKWTWMQTVSTGNDRLLGEDHGTSVPDSSSLNLFRARYRWRNQHRSPAVIDHDHVAGRSDGSLHSHGYADDQRSRANAHEQSDVFELYGERFVKEEDPSVVFYEDLLHPSYKKS